ncbi:hypothetical protein MKY82_33920 [Paenibacillus sp. FSL W7-1279]|uniref:hypothetical protein n=1 Tax=Paenibacillus sp. FSL W7-1279 TaxID=2921697 RepID=UPI0030D9E5A0
MEKNRGTTRSDRHIGSYYRVGPGLLFEESVSYGGTKIGFFVLALVMLIYAWCGFRYEAFQRFMFHMSPSNLMIDNPEPSDFYFFMCKAAGIFGMDSHCGYFFSGIMTKKARFRHGSAPSKTGFFNRF